MIIHSATPLRTGTNDIEPTKCAQGNSIRPAFSPQKKLEVEFSHHIMGVSAQ